MDSPSIGFTVRWNVINHLETLSFNEDCNKRKITNINSQQESSIILISDFGIMQATDIFEKRLYSV